MEEILTQQVLLQEVLVFSQLNQAIVVLTDLEIQEVQDIQVVLGSAVAAEVPVALVKIPQVVEVVMAALVNHTIFQVHL